MKTKSFLTLHVAKLTVTDLYSLNKSTIDFAQPVKETIGDLPKASLAKLETDNAAMGALLNKQSRSGLTTQLSDKDKERDERFAEIKRNITTSLLGSNEVNKSAAESIKLLFEPYWHIDKKAMNTETAMLIELFGKIKSAASIQEQASLIDITNLLAELENSNNEFDVLYKLRNSQMAAQDSASASSLKPAAIRSYEQFCTSIEQAVNLIPNEALISLYNQMDELRGKYARLISKADNSDEASSEQ